MMKDNQVSENCFSTRFGRLASEFAKILNGGLFSKRQFAGAAWSHFLTGCFIESFLNASRSSGLFISASAPEVGRIV